jgi:hypothetical protein
MNTRTLYVLNCKHPKNVSSSIKEILNDLFCFRPETCSRSVIIFCNPTDAEVTKILGLPEKLKERTSIPEIFSGDEAYKFLLRWSVGLLSVKHHHNDRFVLGRVITRWTQFCEQNAEQLKGTDYLKIIPALLADAHTVRSKVEKYFCKMNNDARIIKTEAFCDEIYLQRTKAEKTPEKSLQRSIESNLNHQSPTDVTEKLAKKMQGLQKQIAASDKTIKIKAFDNEEQRGLLIKTKLSITAAWQKRQIEHIMQEEMEDSFISRLFV